MNISPVTNSPNMKAGLYFAKPGVLFNPRDRYFSPEGQKITQKGVRYFEDKQLPEEIRKKVAKIPFIKNLSEKHETFVNVFHGKREGTQYGKIKIEYADKKMKVHTYEAYGTKDREPSIGSCLLEFLKLIGTIFAPFCDFEKEEPNANPNPIDLAIEKINKGKFDSKYKV